MSSARTANPVLYGRILLFVAGLGGLLYGIDVGIVAAALLYLDKTVNLTVSQTSWIVAAVFAGSTVSSLVAGFLADWIGRKKMMVLSGLLFVTSVGLIVLSQNFASLLTGRLLQGISGGMIAVVVPLYLAETLSPKSRGRGSAIFQFMLTVGIAGAAFIGYYYTSHADAAIAAANGNATLILAAQNHAWRGMFLSVIYPGAIFFLGTIFLSESPRWLFRRGRKDAAMAALLRSTSQQEAELQLHEMEANADESKAKKASGIGDSLLQRKYILPFLLACIILACNQATGINSILSYLVLILRQAGMTAAHATQGDIAVKLLNVLMTTVAVALIDKRGRKFLLTLGTGGVIVALVCGGILFHSIESKRVDVRDKVQAAVKDGRLDLPVSAVGTESGESVLTVTYSYGSGDKVASALSDDKDPAIHIAPESSTSQIAAPVATPRLEIKRATYGAVPGESTGWWMTAFLSLFIAAFAAGPGVVVWLALSELMPTRIRSAGMGIALLINQGVSTTIAGVFLPVVGHYGYYAMFFFWAACTVVYFITAAFFLPETKGKTLEEIEKIFGGSESASQRVS